MNDKNLPISVLVADDHPIFRRGLCSIIESSPHLKLIGEAENGEIALELVEKLNPAVIVLDIDMPKLDGIAVARILQKKSSAVKVIFLTMYKDHEILDAVKKLNVKGYVLKDGAIAEIVRCILQVAAGKNYFSPELSDLFTEESEITKAKTFLISILTTAERRILRFIAQLKTNREIAVELFVSVRTVENHRFNICTKLGLKGNHSLTKFVLENKNLILAQTKDL